jgi:hypothetical protein
MAHFAQIDENNIVTQVIVVHNNDCLDVSGQENEAVGAGFCARLFGGNWKQTSYNSNIRKNYAGIGFSYDAIRDAFIPPKLYNSWVLDEETCGWLPPVPMPVPQNDEKYRWDESTTNWVVITE